MIIQQKEEKKEWLGVSFKPENFIPGLIIGFIFGLFLDLSKPNKASTSATKRSNLLSSKNQRLTSVADAADEELKMVTFHCIF